ncbi:MAG TPA: hypothetical protein VE028_04375 [Nitratidesulfovibrio sp.]|nr:hypothetical protein [Nitratidesulfovibrio sp.]
MNESIRSIANPYEYSTHLLERNDFIGRDTFLQDFRVHLDEYEKTGRMTNIVLQGERSIGKSSLLHRYKNNLTEMGFLVYSKEFAIDEDVNEFHFFKDVIDFIYTNVDPIKDTCLDSLQQEIWYRLTEENSSHDTGILDRGIRFATQYQQFVTGHEVTLSLHTLSNDIGNIIAALKQHSFIGLAVLLDEFQELSRNSVLLSHLRQLSEQHGPLVIVAAGLPVTHERAGFDKFSRTARIQMLEPLAQDEALRLIISPLENKARITRYEALNAFDRQSLLNVVSRTNGNPLHIKVLCAKMFEKFQRNPDSTHISLNRDVMDDAMSYYASISENSKIIQSALQSCGYDELRTFARVYKYQELSLRSVILLKNAFNPLNQTIESELKDSLIDEMSEIWDLGLFTLNGKDLTLTDLRTKSPGELSNVEYKFIGDAIDRMYASYVYEDITKERLIENSNLRFEDLLAHQFGIMLYNELLPKKVEISLIEKGGVFQRTVQSPQESSFDIIKDTTELGNMTNSQKLSEENKGKINTISKKYSLEIPAHLAIQNEYSGYYVIYTSINVRGKHRYLFMLCPSKNGKDEFPDVDLINEFTKHINYQFEQYLLTVNSINLYWISTQTLLPVIRLSKEEGYSMIEKYAKSRDFDRCAILLEGVRNLTAKFRDRKMLVDADDHNNYGFALMNIGKLDSAAAILQESSKMCMISLINIAYIDYLRGDLEAAKKKYKKMVTATVFGSVAKFINLAIEKGSALPTVVEMVEYKNISSWNAALISAQLNEPHSIANSFLKNATPTNDDEKLIHLRVLAWINYYRDSHEKSITLLEQLCAQSDACSYIFNDAQMDMHYMTQHLSVKS